VVIYTAVFSLASPPHGWLLFWTGALPALLVFYLRRRVTDAPIVAQQRERDQHRGSIGSIFGRRLGRTTFLRRCSLPVFRVATTHWPPGTDIPEDPAAPDCGGHRDLPGGSHLGGVRRLHHRQLPHDLLG
jgi:hypothetical protein